MHSQVIGFKDKCDARKKCEFRIMAFDALNRPRTRGGDRVVVEITPKNAWAAEQKERHAKVDVVDNGDGSYSVGFTTPCGGLYAVSLLLNSTPIQAPKHSVDLPNYPRTLLSIWQETAHFDVSERAGSMAFGENGLLYVATTHGVCVVRKDGSISGYVGKSDIQHALLAVSEEQIFVASAAKTEVLRADGSVARSWSTRSRGGAIAVDAKSNELFAINGPSVDVLSCNGKFLRRWFPPYEWFAHSTIALDSHGHVYVRDHNDVLVSDRHGKLIRKWKAELLDVTAVQQIAISRDDLVFVSYLEHEPTFFKRLVGSSVVGVFQLDGTLDMHYLSVTPERYVAGLAVRGWPRCDLPKVEAASEQN